MPMLNIGGRRVTVGDEFLKLSPEEQNNTVDEIARSLDEPKKRTEAPSAARSAAIGTPIMAGPWEKYAQGSNEEPKPWEKYGQLAAPAEAAPSAARSAAIGLGQDITGGWQDELAGLAGASGLPVGTPPIVTAPVGLYRKLTGSPGAEEAYRRERDRFRSVQAEAEKAHPYATGGAELAGVVGSSVLPAKAIGLGTTVAGNALRGGLVGGLLGGVQGAGEANEAEDIPSEAALGLGFGAPIGFAVPYAAKGLGRLLSPFRSPAAKQEAADILRKEGVDLTAGQRTGNRALLAFESEMGGGTAHNFAERQGEQYTAAALKRAGEDANRARPEVINRMFKRVGGEFDRLSSMTDISHDAKLTKALTKVENDYNRVVGPNARSDLIQNTISDISDASANNNGKIPGKFYKTLRSELERDAKRTSSPELKMALGDVQEAMDNAAQRSSGNKAEWAKARRQYASANVLANSIARPGEAAAEGLISPARLRSAQVASIGRRGYARGHGDLTGLAAAGESAMPYLLNSWTAQRAAAHGLFGVIGGLAGEREGGHAGGVAGALLTMAAPRLAAKAALSQIGRNVLSNQLAGRAYQPILQGGNLLAQAIRERALRDNTQ